MLANRLRKRQKHLSKWARRSGVTCYRLYDRDIPEYPCVVDWYEGEVVVWLYERTRDETADQQAAFRTHTLDEIQAGLDVQLGQIFIKERAVQKGLDSQYEKVGAAQAVRIVQENGLNFEVNLSDYLDTGLFLDHRPTRQMVRERAKGQRVLNLFAYTGSFTVYAIAGGARQTTTVDLSQTYCLWAERNWQHNGFTTNAHHRILAEDCLQFLQDAAKRREKYDIIVCDPPTFSNSKKMAQASFAVDRDQVDLLRACGRLLAPQGELFFSNNSRQFKLDEKTLSSNFQIRDITAQTIPEDFRNGRIHQCWLLTRKKVV
ncbi:MAG: class I SAM-dependent methyltransferase [Ardenticatenaceae bacterium]|nr:class I SAM-dependent methyltransferase [Ardenticatenaceae bacterium]